MHCPECVKEARATAPRTRPALLTAFRPSSGRPLVTWSLIAVTVAVFILQMIPGSPVTQALLYYPPFTYTEPWRMITTVFVHSEGSIFHILLNMYSLFIFGSILEQLVGRWRFLALYLLSGLGGSVAVLLLSPQALVVGASGAIFGVVAAFVVIQRGLGRNNVQLLVLVGINLVIGFVPGFNISWQAHLGGLIVGAAIGLVYLRTRRVNQRTIQVALMGGIFAVLLALTLFRLFVIG